MVTARKKDLFTSGHFGGVMDSHVTGRDLLLVLIRYTEHTYIVNIIYICIQMQVYIDTVLHWKVIICIV